MSVTVDQVTAYTGAGSSDSSFVASSLATAQTLIEQYAGQAWVPDEILDRATLEVASELFYRRQSPQGISQFATADGVSPIRVSRDPMIGAYPLLAPFVGVGIA